MRKKLIQGSLIGLLAAGGILAIWFTGALETWEYTTWSWRVRTFAPHTPPHPHIKVILLDQTSLDWGKKENGWAWPWPREVYSTVIDFCRRGGAKAVAFDVLYTEPSIYGAADDLALGDALRRTSNFVGACFFSAKSGDATNWPAGYRPPALSIQNLDPWLARHPAAQLVMPRAAFPIPEISTNAALLASVKDQPDSDGLFRRAVQFRIFDGQVVPSLGLATYLIAEKTAGRTPSLRLDHGWLEVGGVRVPIDDRGSAILRFCENGTHETYNAAAVIQSELRLRNGEKPSMDPAMFKDAYVFFGFSAPGLGDLVPSPINRAYAGVEIHATSLDNLLTRASLRDTPSAAVAVATLLLGLLSGAAIAMARKASWSVLVFAVALPIPVLAALAAYPLGWWWPLVVTEGGVAAALLGGVVLNYATEGRQKAFLKRAFKHYLGAEVIEQIISNPERLKLGGEKRELTLFFSDIEKFSSFSEKLDPETLTSLLNAYLTDMTDIILEEGGYLDKYIGDAIVAFWNAPADQPDQAIRAVRTVVRCQRRLAEQRAHYQQTTGVTIKARIGMNTGEVTVGNMGSRDRFNYTVLGDAANLASRLEGANKAFGTYAMISETTWTRTQGQFIGRELGRIRVVGREKPVRVYEVFGFAGESLPAFVHDFEAGLAQCMAGQWAQALALFERHPEDPPSVAYAVQCRKLMAAGSTWDGIWSLTDK